MIYINQTRKFYLLLLPFLYVAISFLSLTFNNAPLPIISVIALLLTLSFCILVLGHNFALLNPVFMFCILQLTLYSLNWLPFISSSDLFNDTYYGSDHFLVERAIIKLNLLTALWVLIATFTFKLFTFKTKWKSIDLNINYKLIGFLIIFISFISTYILISKAGSIFDLIIQREITREDRLAAEIGRHWFALAQIGPLGIALWAFSDKYAFIKWYFLPILFLLLAIGFIVSGNRTSIVMSCILVYGAWAFRSRKIFSIKIFLLFSILISLLGVATIIRDQGISYFQNSNVSFNDSEESTIKKIWDIRSERAISGSASLGVIMSIEKGEPYIYGESYKSLPYIFIPSSILSYEKPPAGGRLAAKTLSGRTDTAWPISPIVETYWNFGIIGVAFSSFFYGLLSSFIFNIMKNNYNSTLMLVGYFSFITLFSVGSDGFYKFFQVFVPLVFLYFLIFATKYIKRRILDFKKNAYT